MYFTERAKLQELMQTTRLPVAYALRDHVVAGGLLSYGYDLAANYRDAAKYVDKILKGAKPADLPVEQATKFELVINLKTAKALGITIPQIAAAARGRGDPVMDRRTFVGAVGGGPARACRLPLQAQQPAKVASNRVFSSAAIAPMASTSAAAFRQGLRELGWVDGQNVVIEVAIRRWARLSAFPRSSPNWSGSRST